MKTERARGVAALSIVVLAALAPAASAQYAADPFFNSTVAQSRAITMEMVGTKLKLAQTFGPPFDEELAERFEAMAGPDWERFGATLAEVDPALAEELRTTLEEIGEAAEKGEETAELARSAQEILARAYDLVIPPEVRGAPAFKGAILIDLLLAEGGVAEGYEEAVENVWEYPGGWASLGRVDELWSEVAPLATEERRADAQEMFAMLRELYPNAGPPESTIGWNPEEAEPPAQRLGGILEEVVDANLYPGRDLPRLAEHLAGVVDESRAAYEGGNEGIGAEGIAAVYNLYSAHLGDTAEVFAPDGHARAQELFAALVTVGDDDDDADAAAADGDDATACRSLSETLLEIRGVFGG